jgi:DNA-binding GntR family transcriptional regulator
MKGLLGEKVTAQSLVDVVTERLQSAIISGALKPGSRLSEQGLADSMGLSRGPLREAISRLEGRKLLERTPNIGVRVAALSLKDFCELLAIREVLEGLACGLAAKHMTDKEIAGVKDLLRQHEREKSVREGKGYYPDTQDYDFHSRIAAGSRNDRLIEMLNGDILHLMRIYRDKTTPKPGRAVQALGQHKAIVEALARRDPVAAEQRMREHLRSARLFIEQQLAEGGTETAGAPAAASPAARRGVRTERVASLMVEHGAKRG